MEIDVCRLLSSPTLWILISVWEVVKMVLMIFARYYVFLPCHNMCPSYWQRVFRALLYAIIVFQCYVSSFVWMSLLFLYFHHLSCGNVLALVVIFVESLVNAIFCFVAVYFNVKSRPHHTVSKQEAKDMFKRLEASVPEIRIQFYSIKSVSRIDEQMFPPQFRSDPQETASGGTFSYSHLERLLDNTSEFVALLKLEVRPFEKKAVEEYKMVLYRFSERSSFNLSEVQILSIVEEQAPSMSIALTSHHSTRLLIVNTPGQKQGYGSWLFFNILCPYFGTFRNFLLKDQCIRLSVVKTLK